MAETLPLEKLEEKVESLYEAIVIIAKRARQINELQRQMIQRERDLTGEENDLEDETIDEDMLESQYIKLPKPTTIALKEMLDDDLNYEYVSDE